MSNFYNKQSSHTSSGVIKQIKSSYNCDTIQEKEQPIERILCYYEISSGRKIRYKINFDSPRTSGAAEQLGITFEQCQPKYSFNEQV